MARRYGAGRGLDPLRPSALLTECGAGVGKNFHGHAPRRDVRTMNLSAPYLCPLLEVQVGVPDPEFRRRVLVVGDDNLPLDIPQIVVVLSSTHPPWIPPRIIFLDHVVVLLDD